MGAQGLSAQAGPGSLLETQQALDGAVAHGLGFSFWFRPRAPQSIPFLCPGASFFCLADTLCVQMPHRAFDRLCGTLIGLQSQQSCFQGCVCRGAKRNADLLQILVKEGGFSLAPDTWIESRNGIATAFRIQRPDYDTDVTCLELFMGYVWRIGPLATSQRLFQGACHCFKPRLFPKSVGQRHAKPFPTQDNRPAPRR